MTTITVSRPATVAEMQAEIDRLTAAHALQYDEIERLRAEVNVLIRMALETWEMWDADQDARVGKMLKAMADLEFRRRYRPDLSPNDAGNAPGAAGSR